MMSNERLTDVVNYSVENQNVEEPPSARTRYFENNIPCQGLNKILSSQWLSDNQVLVGTRCQRLFVFDVEKKHQPMEVATLAAGEGICIKKGISFISTNPSRTFVATSGRNSNEVAVYKLPTFQPIFLGVDGHTHKVRSGFWLDDDVLITSSYDDGLIVWRMPEDAVDMPAGDGLVTMNAELNCKKKQNIHMTYCRFKKEICSISKDGYVTITGIEDEVNDTWTVHSWLKNNTTCLTAREQERQYAVGCTEGAVIIDPRSPSVYWQIPLPNENWETRSISYIDNVLALGASGGHGGKILFYDVRSPNNLMMNEPVLNDRCVELNCTPQLDNGGCSYEPAVFTHCCNDSGNKLWVAGGPRLNSKRGAFASLMQASSSIQNGGNFQQIVKDWF